ncbi:unnamed protein product [Plutella xylostella]|uniref:(diamondback moth) hypothetical protein n=1 Tax=Plutella xylostella TaxID=51655 RepID=A0A8S4FWJ7_PLUXY|nr:unnamed protein product [Plutella xylostella]
MTSDYFILVSGELMFLNEATLLNNIITRYKKDKIYTYVANILLAVNPYKDIKDMYSSSTIKKYQGKSLGELPPHVFAVADKAFRDMKSLKQSQSIIVSGESGAGKTESTKYILKYLCDLWASGAGPVEQKILDANPILEAFGNAKTTRNNNSSRFGKFMEVHFNSQWQVVGGHISHYLLEKSRICTQSAEERNYHVFYLLCAGAPPELRARLKITKPDDFQYLKNGCTQYFTRAESAHQLQAHQQSQQQRARGGLRDPVLDDAGDFARLHQALSRVGLSEAEKTSVYSIVAAVLHLGNIEFEEDPSDTRGGCHVKPSSEGTMATAAGLLGVDSGELRMSLVSRLMQSSRGGMKGTAIMVPLKMYEACNARDALAKAVYSRLFDHIVHRINASIPFQASAYYIGVLDIAGFDKAVYSRLFDHIVHRINASIPFQASAYYIGVLDIAGFDKAVYSRLFDHIVHRINASIPFQASAYYIGVLDIAGFDKQYCGAKAVYSRLFDHIVPITVARLYRCKRATVWENIVKRMEDRWRAVYSRLFDHIVHRINASIPFQASAYYIGVLDIAGFEYFQMNSFEQFCINYCNEKLQQFFNERILKNEQELYKREGLHVPEIRFTDNQDCIDLIESKSHGIFQLLDEESKLPKPEFGHFTHSVHKQLGGTNSRLQLPRASRLKAHRTLRDDEGFLLRHFAGAVCYNTNQFIEKNNDALHASLEFLVQESSSALVQQLFQTSDNNNAKGKLNFISVGSKFQTQLTQLMDKLKQNGTNFIRCIKPNSRMVGASLEPGLVLTQLECSGTIAVLELMEHGYPSRAPFHDLHQMYKSYLPPKLHKLNARTFCEAKNVLELTWLSQLECSGTIAVLELMEHGYPSRAPFHDLHQVYKSYLPPKLHKLNARTFCEAVLHSFKLSDKDYKFGVTRVFFRPGKYSEFDAIMRSDPESLKAIVDSVLAWLVKSRWRKSIFAALSIIKLKNKILYRRECLIKIQTAYRGYRVRKQHRPRLRGIAKIRALENNLGQMEQVTGQLKDGKEAAQKNIVNLRNSIRAACAAIKSNAKISPPDIDSLFTNLTKDIEAQMTSLQKSMVDQKNREEQERLRKLEAEMRAAEEAKRREQEQRRQDEEHRRLKAEMEARRKAEEAERLQQQEKERQQALQLQAQLEAAERDHQQDRERLEQERRDHEMAVRLAKETNGHVEGSPPQLRSFPTMDSVNGENKLNRSERVRMQQAMQGKQKYDLSKWKYSELRDTINTSCDIELLEACRHEFHRRLKVYHAWKAKNARKTTMADQERAPQSIMDAAKAPRMTAKGDVLGARHRYFRIPFVRPSTTEPAGRRGWWYAHFDGQYVARQMELHPDKTPVLLQSDERNPHPFVRPSATEPAGRRGWWYAHFDGQYVARQMELHPDKTPVLLQSGVDDMQMCELSLDETGLTRKRGAEILEHEFEREWTAHGGPAYVPPELRKR